MRLLSWSRIRMWRDCKCKFHLYEEGVTQEPVEGFAFGVALHEALEQYVGHCQATGVPQDAALADSMAAGMTDTRLARAVRKFPATITIRPDLVPVGLETSFELPIGDDWLFRGRIDRVELDGETVRIIDYKSGFKPEYPKQPDGQLLTYAAAWQRLHGGQRFELRQVWPEADPQLPSPSWVVEGDLSLALVDEAIREIEAESTWEARASQKGCSFCPYLTTACPLKPEVITSDDDALIAYQRSIRLMAQVKEYTQDHLVDGLPQYMAPSYVARGEGHYAIAGSGKEKQSNATEAIRHIFVHASAGAVKLASALDIKTSWLNREIPKGTELAADLMPYVYQIPPRATWREQKEEAADV